MNKQFIGAIKLIGEFDIRHFRNGKLLSCEHIHNTTTNVGFAEVAGLINEATTIGFKWLALDSSSTAATAANTALAAEITANGLTRVAATCSRTTITQTNDTARLQHTWTATGAQTVQGAGVFDTSTASAGILLARTTFTAKGMEADDTLNIDYKVKVA